MDDSEFCGLSRVTRTLLVEGDATVDFCNAKSIKKEIPLTPKQSAWLKITGAN